jgi:hypothetical protein
MTQPEMPPFQSELFVHSLTELRVPPSVAGGVERIVSLSDRASREELLGKLAAGEVVEAILDIVAYVQRETPNRNFVRFKKGQLSKIAKSFKGNVVLFDHDQRHVSSRVGTILASKAEKTDEGTAFMQTLHITDPRAVEGLLRGTLDRFSIGWLSTGPIVCSIHGTPLFRECDCWPGDEVKGRVAEAEFTDADGIEVSFVNVPAVVGTGIDNVRAALEAHCGGPPPRSKKMDPKMIKAMLGLPQTATEDEVLAALGEREAQLKKLGEAQAVTERQLATEREQRKETLIEQLYAEGKLEVQRGPDGKRRQTEAELALRELDVDMLAKLAKAMPRVVSVDPAVRQSDARPAPTVARAGGSYADNPYLEDCLEQVGLSLSDVEKFGPHHRKLQADKDRPVPKSLAGVFKTSNDFSRKVIEVSALARA